MSVHEDPIANEAERSITTDDEDLGAELAEIVSAGADSIEMVEFTEPSAMIAHGHGPVKGEGTHDVRGAFGVREEFINAHFQGGVVPNGHEGVHLLLAGKESFIESGDPIFEDVPNDDSDRWEKIARTAKSASIPPGRRAELDALY